MRDITKELLYAIIGLAGITYGMYGGYLATGLREAAGYAGYFGIGGLLFGIAKGYQLVRAKELGSTDEIMTRLREELADGSE